MDGSMGNTTNRRTGKGEGGAAGGAGGGTTGAAGDGARRGTPGSTGAVTTGRGRRGTPGGTGDGARRGTPGGADGAAGVGTRNGSSAGEQRRTGARPQDTRALPYGAHGDLPDAAVPHSELASQVTIDNPDDAELVPEAESVAAIEDAPTQVVLDNPDDGDLYDVGHEPGVEGPSDRRRRDRSGGNSAPV